MKSSYAAVPVFACGALAAFMEFADTDKPLALGLGALALVLGVTKLAMTMQQRGSL